MLSLHSADANIQRGEVPAAGTPGSPLERQATADTCTRAPGAQPLLRHVLRGRQMQLKQ